MSRPCAVLFDCDGTLVDTEQVCNSGLTTLLNSLGIAISVQECRSVFTGLTTQDTVHWAAARLGPRTPPDLARQIEEMEIRAVASEVVPLPGVSECLAQLTCPCAVVSNGSLAKMRASLTSSGLIQRFEGRLFSSEQVARGKPDPAVYLLAAHALECEPCDCWVVEDSIAGIESGMSAGMRVFGLTGHLTATEITAARATPVGSFYELVPFLPHA
ncbi:MAG: HAD family phosphatase [Chthonomonas sp.]|nr:HAD family phosphatase [Chthonomonas sp.]